MAIKLSTMTDDPAWFDKKSISTVIGNIRRFIRFNCQEKGTLGHLSDPSDIRQNPSEFPSTCRALAEMEYQLVRLHDGNFHEIADTFDKTVGRAFQEWRETYKRAYGKYPEE